MIPLQLYAIENAKQLICSCWIWIEEFAGAYTIPMQSIETNTNYGTLSSAQHTKKQEQYQTLSNDLKNMRRHNDLLIFCSSFGPAAGMLMCARSASNIEQLFVFWLHVFCFTSNFGHIAYGSAELCVTHTTFFVTTSSHIVRMQQSDHPDSM